MKKIILIISIIIFAQPSLLSQQYDSIVNRNKVWSNYFAGLGANFVECCKTTRINKITDDTIINALKYRKVLESEDSMKTWKTVGYIREVGKKVYFANLKFETGLIYYFNLKQGDSVYVFNYNYNQIFPMKVSLVDTFEWSGIKRIRYSFKIFNDFVSEQWIVGIGSDKGLLNSGKGVYLTPGGLKELLCVSQSGNEIFYNTIRQSCYISNITSQKEVFSKNLIVSPNPVSRTILFKGLDFSIGISFKLYNSLGQQVLSDKLFSNSYNLPHLSDGIYAYCLVNKGQMIKGKVIVKH